MTVVEALTPAAPVVAVGYDWGKRRGNVLVLRVHCPFCGERHKHGGLGLRTSSCGKGYIVALPPSTGVTS